MSCRWPGFCLALGHPLQYPPSDSIPCAPAGILFLKRPKLASASGPWHLLFPLHWTFCPKHLFLHTRTPWPLVRKLSAQRLLPQRGTAWAVLTWTAPSLSHGLITNFMYLFNISALSSPSACGFQEDMSGTLCIAGNQSALNWWIFIDPHLIPPFPSSSSILECSRGKT